MKLTCMWNKKTTLNSIANFLIGLGLIVSGDTCAQQAAPLSANTHSDGTSTVFSWGGLTWHIPTRFFMGIRPHSNYSDDLFIQFRWTQKNESFSPVDTNGNEMELDIHIRKIDDEDPRNALALIRRINLPFAKVPVFANAKFNEMTYLGSSSNIHYFFLANENAYVSCRLINGMLTPPAVPADVLSRAFTCNTVFFLPHNTYA